jgi:hypothetical protein
MGSSVAGSAGAGSAVGVAHAANTMDARTSRVSRAKIFFFIFELLQFRFVYEGSANSTRYTPPFMRSFTDEWGYTDVIIAREKMTYNHFSSMIFGTNMTATG